MMKDIITIKKGIWEEGCPAHNDSPTPIEYRIPTPADPYLNFIVASQIIPKWPSAYEIDSDMILMPNPPSFLTELEDVKAFAVKYFEKFILENFIEGVKQ